MVLLAVISGVSGGVVSAVLTACFGSKLRVERNISSVPGTTTMNEDNKYTLERFNSCFERVTVCLSSHLCTIRSQTDLHWGVGYYEQTSYFMIMRESCV